MRKEVKLLAVIAVLVVIAGLVGAKYYRDSLQSQRVTSNSNTGSSAGKPKASAEQLVRPDSPVLGNADAKVTLVEFYDPECESCAAFSPVIKKIMKDYNGQVKLVSRYMPLHPNSITAATFIEAAAEQGKYWQAQEMLFMKQPEWGTKHGAPPTEQAPPINVLFDRYAKELGLDMTKAAAAVRSHKFDAKIEQDKKDGQALGVRRTPSFFVNGRMLATFGEAPLRSLIEEELKN
jgi:protein-disulfide isomerase